MAQSIGFFQFDNLVRGRVGFVFINLGVDTNTVYPHVFKMHLEQKLLQLPEGSITTASNEQILEAMKGHAKESAVIVLDAIGARAEDLAGALDSAGFINVFFVKGGWEACLKEQT